MSLLRAFVKTCIVLFSLWHMAAIGVYSLQNVDSQPVLKWLEQKQYIFRPYVLATSQWQRWNLFSPDPLRRVTEMRIDRQIFDTWMPVRNIVFGELSYFRRASELKVMRRMDEDNQVELKDRYIQDICRTDGLLPGTPMRIIKRVQVIPKTEGPQTVEWWMQWQPEWQEMIDYETTCSANLTT